MYRTSSVLLVSAALLSFTLAHAENLVPLYTPKALGLNAEHQSNDEADVEITRKIRQALVKDDDLSLYAHNVKIITVDKQVTLIGPVRSPEEKLKVERMAQDLAGKESVISALELVR